MIAFVIPPDHVWQHFSDSDKLGSHFFAKSPSELLTVAATEFSHLFRDAKPDPVDGRMRLSFHFDYEIGLCNVVALSELTSEELATIAEEERDGVMVKTVRSSRTFPTREFQLILSSDNTVITMFPGPMAPPLPKSGESSDFWDNHVFIKL